VHVHASELGAAVQGRHRLAGVEQAAGVESVLDGILDFCFEDSMLCLYKKLCRYYFTPKLSYSFFNPKKALEIDC